MILGELMTNDPNESLRAMDVNEDPDRTKFLRLTSDEVSIWAAVYASYFYSIDIRLDPAIPNQMENLVLAAASAAEMVIQTSRKVALASLKKSQCDKSEADFMLRTMVNRQDAEKLDDDERWNVIGWLTHHGYQETLKTFVKEAEIEGWEEE
jgi:hypothetical protein